MKNTSWVSDHGQQFKCFTDPFEMEVVGKFYVAGVLNNHYSVMLVDELKAPKWRNITLDHEVNRVRDEIKKELVNFPVGKECLFKIRKIEEDKLEVVIIKQPYQLQYKYY